MNDQSGRESQVRIPIKPVSWLRSARAPILAAILLYVSFPPWGYSLFALVALIPLLTMVSARWKERPIYGPALAGGALFGLLSVSWIRHSDQKTFAGYLGWFTLAAYLALYFPAFVLLMRIAILRFKVPALLATPVVWVGLEYLRGWALTGFPWYFLGHALYRWTSLIQIADLAGAYAVSFCAAMVNGWIYDIIAVPFMRPGENGPKLASEQRWRLTVIVLMFGMWISYGWARGRAPASTQGPVVALMQTNLPQELKTDESRRGEIISHYGELIKLLDDQSFDLVVWPETAYRGDIYRVDEQVTDADVKRLFGESGSLEGLKEAAKKWDNILAKTLPAPGVSTLTGLNGLHVFPERVKSYNSAILVDPEHGLSRLYHKIHLVPWGEYLPFRDTLPILTALTPHASADYGADAGNELVRIRWRDMSFAVLICFEDTIPWLARSYVSRDPVDFFVNISNDGWFLDSAESEVHLAASVFRSVECGRPMIRAVNTSVGQKGPVRASAVIDVRGVVVKDSAMGLRAPNGGGVLITQIPLEKRETFYAMSGDWLGLTTFVIIIVMLVTALVMSLVFRRRQSLEQ